MESEHGIIDRRSLYEEDPDLEGLQRQFQQQQQAPAARVVHIGRGGASVTHPAPWCRCGPCHCGARLLVSELPLVLSLLTEQHCSIR